MGLHGEKQPTKSNAATPGKGVSCGSCHAVPTAEQLSDPAIWGRAWWTSMLATAYSYPDAPAEEDKTKYAAYFNSISGVLPCAKCRGHFSDLLNQHPIEPHLSCSKDLLAWVVARKNDVNLRLGKRCPTEEHVCKTWKQKLYGRKNKQSQVLLWVMALFGAFLLAAVLFYFLGKTTAHRRASNGTTPSDEQGSAASRPFYPRVREQGFKPKHRPAAPPRKPLVESFLPSDSVELY